MTLRHFLLNLLSAGLFKLGLSNHRTYGYPAQGTTKGVKAYDLVSKDASLAADRAFIASVTPTLKGQHHWS